MLAYTHMHIKILIEVALCCTYPINSTPVFQTGYLFQQCLCDCCKLLTSRIREDGLIVYHTLSHKGQPLQGEDNLATFNGCPGIFAEMWQWDFLHVEDWHLNGK